MKKVALVIGHGPKVDLGAVNKAARETELNWNTDLAQRIKDRLSGRAEGVIVKRTTERLQPVMETNATKADAAVELHLNAFNGSASGTEMIAVSKRGRELATLLQAAAVRVLGLPDRGVKGPQGGGRGQRWLNGTSMPAVIVESFFIDNDKDLARANAKKDDLAQGYADAIVSFLT